MSKRSHILTSLCLVAWSCAAHAHGQEAVVFAISVVVALLLIPFVGFLFFWRVGIKRKLILLVAYSASIPLAMFLAFALVDVALAKSLGNLADTLFFGTLIGIPVVVWVGGVLMFRKNATQQVAPGDAPKAARP